MRYLVFAATILFSCTTFAMEKDPEKSKLSIKILASALFPRALFSDFFFVPIADACATISSIKQGLHDQFELCASEKPLCMCTLCDGQKATVKIAKAVKDKKCFLHFKRTELSDSTTIAELIAQKEFNPAQDCLSATHSQTVEKS